MINSRRIEDLTPETARLCQALLEKCAAEGIDLIVTSTYRDFASQTALYNQGRTPESKARGEKIVTNAKAGRSFHNYRVAFDVVPVVGGKAVWNNEVLWNRIGAIGKNLGLEWAGDWKSFKEKAHFQLPGLSLDELQSRI